MSAVDRIKAELDRVALERAHNLVYSWATELEKLEAIDLTTIEIRKNELRALIAEGQAIIKDGMTVQAEIRKQVLDPAPIEIPVDRG